MTTTTFSFDLEKVLVVTDYYGFARAEITDKLPPWWSQENAHTSLEAWARLIQICKITHIPQEAFRGL